MSLENPAAFPAESCLWTVRGGFIRFFVIAILLGASVKVPAATSLLIEFTDEAGRKVTPVSAELLLVAWGDTDRLALPLEKNSDRLQLPLDADWLRSRWPDRFADMEKAYLYFRADGFAPVRSDEFQWIGSHGPPHGAVVTSALIGLAHGESVRVADGGSARLRVVFRRPQPRSLRIVDTSRQPIAGVNVQARMFWSQSNHCGVLIGKDSLVEVTSDPDGRVALPDGDFEYALEFDKDHYLLAGNVENHMLPLRLITRLDPAEKTITMRQLERKPLLLRATVGGAPAPGRALMGSAANCGCGACGGILRTTDALGEVRIADFYPEQIEELYFEDSSGKRIWRGDARKLDFNQPITVTLDP